MNSNQYIMVITGIDKKRFVVFERTINRLSFGCVCLPQLENYFSCFASFFLLFFSYLFFLSLSAFKPLNTLYSKFEQLKISGRTSVQLKSGVQGWGFPFNRVLQNFEFLNH